MKSWKILLLLVITVTSTGCQFWGLRQPLLPHQVFNEYSQPWVYLRDSPDETLNTQIILADEKNQKYQ